MVSVRRRRLTRWLAHFSPGRSPAGEEPAAGRCRHVILRNHQKHQPLILLPATGVTTRWHWHV
ncbi:hypothetical protein KCP69_03315 [Salmonella enterica subsp. enterica]|nr:hypothetical protein KCP69_03315 [Salmonella enterica subsp. enterica]